MRAGALLRSLVCLVLAGGLTVLPRKASAEKVLASTDEWEVYTDGRAGAFVSWVYGQGYPAPTYGVDANGNFVSTPIFTAKGGGFQSAVDQRLNTDPSLNIPPGVTVPGGSTIDNVSVRSGLIASLLGFGVRGRLTATTSFSIYVQLWAAVENSNQVTNLPSYPDAKQGYAEIQGPWGRFLAGRTRALFSRGLADIEVLYRGPTDIDRIFRAGNFGAGFVYATPAWDGVRLSVGLFDPIALEAIGWTRTKYPLLEAELVYAHSFGASASTTITLFANGAYQKIYKDGFCSPVLDTSTGEAIPCEQTMAGVSSGGRLELGRFRLGVARYYQAGLGLNDTLEVQDAEQDPLGKLRWFEGTYIQSEVTLRRIDVFAGWGLARVLQTDYDRNHSAQDPRDPLNPQALVFPFSVIASQTGINGGIIVHVTPNLHVDLDLFRAQANWTAVNGYPAEKQVIFVTNGGMTMNW